MLDKLFIYKYIQSGVLRFELRILRLKLIVLPLNYTPVVICLAFHPGLAGLSRRVQIKNSFY